MKKLPFLILFLGLSTFPVLAQNDIASSDLRSQINNSSRQKVKNEVPVNQDKSNLKMGTRVCVSMDGQPTRAMVTGGAPAKWGPNKDSYHVTLTSGPKSRQIVFLPPNKISSVGECPEDYVPMPNEEVPANLDVRQLEVSIIKEVNILRANPRAYADEIAKLKFDSFGQKDSPYQAIVLGQKDRLWGCSNNDQSCMNGFLKELRVAIDYLRGVNGPLSPVTENLQLAKGSEMLAADQGKINGPGHKDSRGRGAFDRAKAGGYPNGWRGEVLNAGHTTAAGFVVSFLTSPGHRDILMRKDINEIGVDLHKHGNGPGAFLRDVINVGYSESSSSPVAAKPAQTGPQATSANLTFVPNGNYKQTARNQKVVLDCMCGTTTGQKVKASMDITNLIDPYIVNIDGVLKVDTGNKQPSATFTPAGNYTASCSNVKVTLTSEVKDRKGNFAPSSLNITGLPLGTQINNIDGVLTVNK